MVNLLRGARIDFFHFFTLLTINKIDNNGFRTASELAISVCFCKGRQGCIGNEFQLRRQRRDRQIPGLREARGILSLFSSNEPIEEVATGELQCV